MHEQPKISEAGGLEHLLEIFQALGFPPSVEGQLLLHACFAPASFLLTCRQDRDGDLFLVKALVQRGSAEGAYSCPYYEVLLRRRIVVPAVEGQAAAVRALDERMGTVPWSELLPAAHAEGAALPAEGQSLLRTIVGALQALRNTPEGRTAADHLEAKHWLGTPLEAYCRNLPAIRSAFEIHQRFYLFEGGQLITLEEAYRYLVYRWQERRLQEARREALALAGFPAGKKRTLPGGGRAHPKPPGKDRSRPDGAAA